MATATPDPKAAGKPPHPVPPPAASGAPTITGAMKAALWLLSADEETAVATLAMLSGDEVKKLRRTVEDVQKVAPAQLTGVHHEFHRLLEEQPLRVRGSVEYLARLASRALGEARATALMTPRDALPPSVALMQADVEVLTPVLREEHPQVVAAMMATLSPERAGDLLLRLPEDFRRDVVARVARLNKVPQASVARAQQVLSANLPQTAGDDFDVDGVRIAATLLNQLEAEQAEKILKAFDAEALANNVRQAMFTFEDLKRLDRRGLQALLKEVSSEHLLMALKAASEELREKIFGSLSKRAADMMREDLQMLGPARLADVEKAQGDVVATALKLRDDGKITIVGQGGDYV